ncbi:hypothetical protein MMPV_003661 [Pyropia vietnamensis]
MAVAAVVATAAAAAAATVPSDQGGRGFPTGLFPRYGRLRQVTALQCVADGLHAGGTDGERKGFTLDGRFYAAADGVCAAPLSSLTTLVNGSVPGSAESLRGRHVLRMARDFVPGASPQNVFTRYSPLALSISDGRKTGDAGGNGPRLAFEEDVVALLTLQRNTDGGEVERSSAAFEALSVTRTTRGVCRNQQCNDLTAVDTTGDGACRNFNCANRFNPLATNARADLPSVKARARAVADATPQSLDGNGASRGDVGSVSVVTYTGEDGETRFVSMLQAPLLSLGRSVLAESTWLSHPEWALTADVTVENLHRHVLPAGVEPAMAAGVWNLGGRLTGFADTVASVGATASPTVASSWPQMLAYVLCAGGGRAFTFHSGLCDGLFQRTMATQTVALNGETVQISADVLTPTVAGVFWTVHPRDPDTGDVSSLRQCPALKMASVQPLPSWLAGTTSREINPESVAERQLAANISRCGYPLLEAAPVDEYGALRATEKSSRLADHQRLSIGYDQGVFAVPPPPDPASLADVVIAVVLVLPEAAAAVVMYLSTSRWRRREVCSLTVVLVTGLVALLGIVLLALAEVRGERWRAASLRSSLHVYLTSTAGDCVGRTGPNSCVSPGLRGSALLLSETLIIVARNGYHPRTLVAIAGTAGTVYILGTLWAVVTVSRRFEHRHSLDAAGGKGEDDLNGGGARPFRGGGGGGCCGLRARAQRPTDGGNEWAEFPQEGDIAN